MTRKPDQYRSAADCLAHVDELTAADSRSSLPRVARAKLGIPAFKGVYPVDHVIVDDMLIITLPVVAEGETAPETEGEA